MKRVLTLFSIMFISMGLYACNFNSKPADPTYDPEDLGLAYVTDLKELRSLITTSTKSGGFLRFFSMAGDAVAPENDSIEGGNQDHSTTNVQVDGVDEGDVIKTDGRYIYSITYDRLYVIEVLPNNEAVVVFSQTFDSERGGFYSEIYITEDYLVVIGYHYDYYPYSGSSDPSVPSRDYWYGYGSQMTFVHLYEIGSFELIKEYEVSGSLMTSRLIDNSLYIVSNQYVSSNTDIDPRPYIKDDGDTVVTEFNGIKYFPNMPHNQFTIITHIEVLETPSINFDVFLGQGWGQIYVNQNAIYMATSYYEEVKSLFSSTWIQHGRIVSYQFKEDGSVEFGGVGLFKGQVINQFAMDEYKGTFRMVTTDGWGDDVVNRLYIFEQQTIDNRRILKVIGSIEEGLGKPRETVRSVRFMGDTLTVVTYELIDPFYVIDLSDPTAPVITGELEITGFSTYQHPWTDTLILGIGYEASGNIIEGIKLALYDISNPSNPTEVGSPLILYNTQNAWQYGEALHNHKAILIAKDHGFIGFSIWRWYYYYNSNISTNDYMVFGIDETAAQPISILATISHYSVFTSNTAHFQTQFGQYFDFSIRRAIYIGDYLFVLSGEAMTIHDIHDGFNLVNTLVYSISE